VTNESLSDGVSGIRLRLRLVTQEDAGYIHGLRTDPTYNTHLSAVTGTAEDQRRWIDAYKTREAAGTEYYFVLERHDDGRRCGVVRLYGIADCRFTWGSWILDANKPAKAALESAMLIYDIGFERLGLSNAVFDVKRDNIRAASFHKRFGAIESGSDNSNFYFEYPRARYRADRDRYWAMLSGSES
jgi:RimJ/RimL family protein N-acetyltransferase